MLQYQLIIFLCLIVVTGFSFSRIFKFSFFPTGVMSSIIGKLASFFGRFRGSSTKKVQIPSVSIDLLFIVHFNSFLFRFFFIFLCFLEMFYPPVLMVVYRSFSPLGVPLSSISAILDAFPRVNHRILNLQLKYF